MKKLIVGISLVAVILPLTTFGAYFNAGQSPDVGLSQAIEGNAYIAGGSVTVAAPIKGDLMAAGGTVFASSKVDGDIAAAGGTLILTGISAQDVRAAGGNVTISGTVGGELVAAGGQLAIAPGTSITKDSYLRGASVAFNGSEAGNLDVAGNAVVIGGTIDGNLTIKSGKSVTITSGAVIKGNLEYTAPVKATVEDGAQVGGTTIYHEGPAYGGKERGDWSGPFAALFTILALAKFVASLLLAYLLWYIFKKDSLAMIGEATSHFGRSLLRGFIFLVAVPAAIVLAFISVVGSMLGVLAGFVYGALLILGVPATVLFVSSLLMKCRTDLRWYHILLGAAVLAIAVLIPFIGWIAVFIVWLTAFGALISVIGRKFQR